MRLPLLLLVALVLSVSSATAATIASHPTSRTSPAGYTLWASENYPGNSTYARAFDQFTAAKDDTMGTVQWEGVYINQANTSANPATPNTTTFEVSFWSDNGGQPGQMLDSTTIALADLHPKALGLLPYFFSTLLTVQAPAFGYTATLPRPFAVAAGRTYWLSVLSNSTTQEPTWGWMAGAGGDNQTVQDFVGQRYQREQDRTFKLKSSPGQILTDVGGRAFLGGTALPLSAAFEPPAAGDEIVEVDFLADGVVFASLDGNGNPRGKPGAPVRQAANGDGTLLFQVTFTMPGQDKLVSIVAQALTKLGKTKTSPAVAVQAVATSADQPPAVSVTSPGPARVGVAVNVPVIVTDPDAANGLAARKPVARAFNVPSGVIAKMEYYLNALKVKDSAQAPYGFTFTPTAPGEYVLTAIATDGAGLATASAPVRLEVTAPPTVTVVVKGASTVSESGGAAKVLIARAGSDVSADLPVAYTLKGSAVNGVDYQTLSGTALIPAGAAKVKLKVMPIDDAAANGSRTVKIKLSPSGAGDYQVGAAKKATVVITDDDLIVVGD